MHAAFVSFPCCVLRLLFSTAGSSPRAILWFPSALRATPYLYETTKRSHTYSRFFSALGGRPERTAGAGIVRTPTPPKSARARTRQQHIQRASRSPSANETPQSAADMGTMTAAASLTSHHQPRHRRCAAGARPRSLLLLAGCALLDRRTCQAPRCSNPLAHITPAYC